MSSSVLLGFLENKIKNEADDIEPWKINKIGGQPIFPNNLTQNELNQFEEFITCSTCLTKMIFICQIYCPLEIDQFGRILFIFACKNLKCEYSWAAIRFVFNEDNLVNKSINEVKENLIFEETWEDEIEKVENEKDENEIDENDKNIEKCHSESESNKTLENQSYFTITNLNEKISPYYLIVEKEPLENTIHLEDHINELLKKYKLKEKEREKNKKTLNNEDFDMKETDLLQNYNNDILTYKFYKKIFLQPKQIIRYDWNNKPLVNRSNIDFEETLCDNCGIKRIFEFQIMPGLINYLQLNDSQQINFNFATVLIYTCINNCTKNRLYKEKCVVLNETDTDSFLDFP